MQALNKKMRVGVVGLGHQTLEDHIPAIKASSDVELIGIVEIDEKKIKSFLRENKNVNVYKKP